MVKEIRKYTLKIGKVPEPIAIEAGNQLKGIIAVRDALRKYGIASDVVLISKPKIID